MFHEARAPKLWPPPVSRFTAFRIYFQDEKSVLKKKDGLKKPAKKEEIKRRRKSPNCTLYIVYVLTAVSLSIFKTKTGKWDTCKYLSSEIIYPCFEESFPSKVFEFKFKNYFDLP